MARMRRIFGARVRGESVERVVPSRGGPALPSCPNCGSTVPSRAPAPERANTSQEALATEGRPAKPADIAFSELKQSLRDLLAALVERGLGVALAQVEKLAAGFEDMSARGGAGLGALLGGVQAWFEGRSRVWGAITGLVASLSPAAKAGLILALILATLLLPVTVLLLLLALLVLAVVAAIKGSSHAS